MSRGMSRGGGGFPIIIAVLGVLIIIVIGVFIWMQFGGGSNNDSLDANGGLPTTAPTQIATQVPTVAPTVAPTPEVTVAPTAEPTPEVTPEVTPYVTAAPVYNTNTVWINVAALNIRTQANFESEKVGKIPYAQSITGDISGKWMRVTYEGVQGYIYLGKDASEDPPRDCVKYSESALEPLPDTPDAEELDLVQSTSHTRSGTSLVITITFKEGVYNDDNGTGNLASSDFSVPTGQANITSVSHVAGSQSVTITLFVDSAVVTLPLTIEAQSVFNAAGQACTEQVLNFT